MTIIGSDDPAFRAAEPPSDARVAYDAARVDLLEVLKAGVPEREYVPGLYGIIPKGGRVLMPAKEGSGKTMVALVFAVAVIQAGGSVAYLDFENGTTEMAGRLNTLLDASAARRSELMTAWAEGVTYLDMLNLPIATRSATEWARLLAHTNLVIIDASRPALTLLGLEEDSNDDYSTFAEKVLMPLSRRDVAVLTLDNTGHGKKGRARGASSKSQLNTVVLEPKVITPFSKSQEGLVRITVPRDRTGELTKTFELRLGGGVCESPAPPTVSRDRELTRKVAVEVLTAHAGSMTTKALVEHVARAVHRRNSAVANTLAELAADPASGLIRQPDKSYALDLEPTGDAPATGPTSQVVAQPEPAPGHDPAQPGENSADKPVAQPESIGATAGHGDAGRLVAAPRPPEGGEGATPTNSRISGEHLVVQLLADPDLGLTEIAPDDPTLDDAIFWPDIPADITACRRRGHPVHQHPQTARPVCYRCHPPARALRKRHETPR